MLLAFWYSASDKNLLVAAVADGVVSKCWDEEKSYANIVE